MRTLHDYEVMEALFLDSELWSASMICTATMKVTVLFPLEAGVASYNYRHKNRGLVGGA